LLERGCVLSQASFLHASGKVRLRPRDPFFPDDGLTACAGLRQAVAAIDRRTAYLREAIVQGSFPLSARAVAEALSSLPESEGVSDQQQQERANSGTQEGAALRTDGSDTAAGTSPSMPQSTTASVLTSPDASVVLHTTESSSPGGSAGLTSGDAFTGLSPTTQHTVSSAEEGTLSPSASAPVVPSPSLILLRLVTALTVSTEPLLHVVQALEKAENPYDPGIFSEAEFEAFVSAAETALDSLDRISRVGAGLWDSFILPTIAKQATGVANVA
jgi:hypothetical protein